MRIGIQLVSPCVHGESAAASEVRKWKWQLYTSLVALLPKSVGGILCEAENKREHGIGGFELANGCRLQASGTSGP
jgi:hypothetical protein